MVTKKGAWVVRKRTMWSIYIRLSIEVSISVYLNGLVELRQANLSTASRVTSYLLTTLAVVLLVGLNAAGLYRWCRIAADDTNPTRLEEFFKGLKPNQTAYLYTVLTMARRTLSIMLVTLGVSLPMYAKVAVFFVIQASAWVYVVTVRPFSSTK